MLWNAKRVEVTWSLISLEMRNHIDGEADSESIMIKRHEHLCLILGIVSCTILYCTYFSQPGALNPFQSNHHGKRYAYATFLSSGDNETETEDKYVTATRVLAYQIMHHPDTRTTKNIPFIVVMPPHVPPSVRNRLLSEGIKIVVVDTLLPETWTPEPSQPRWKDQFTKLRLFEMTQFDRILYMDNDMLLTRQLDDIFDEPQVVNAYPSRNNTNNIQDDEAPMPTTYLVAGVADNGGPGAGHPANITSGSAMNGGFFVLRPCKTLFSHYRSILEQRDRFNTGMMEMGLLNYAHRRKGGNMPWKPLSPGKWSSNWPNKEDLDRGSATLHDKFWDEGNAGWIDRRMVEMWWRVQGQMEGYWLAKSDSLWVRGRRYPD